MLAFAAVLGLACALLGALGSAIFAGLSAGARAKRIRASLGEPRTAVADGMGAGVVTLEGTLRADGTAPATRFPYGMSLMEEVTQGAVTAPHGALALEVSGRAIAIDGDVQVILGSRETFEAAGKGMIRALADGDEARARGRLEPVAADTASSYRERAVAYRLRPDGVAVPLAFAGTPRASAGRRHALAAIGAGAIGAVAGFAGAYARPEPIAPPPIVSGAAEASCARTIELAVGQGKFDGEAVAACPDTEQAALAHFYSGDMVAASIAFAHAREAHPELVPSIAEAEAHLFASDDARARAVVQKLADAAAVSTPPAQALACAAAALGRRAGQPDAAPLLDRLVAASPTNEGCIATAYDFRLVWPRLPKFGGFHGAYGDLFLLEQTDHADPRGAHPIFAGRPEVWVVDPGSAVVGEPVGLIASGLEHARRGVAGGIDEREQVASYAVIVAMFHAYLGERAEARRALADVDQLAVLAEGASTERAEYRHYLFGVAAATALHAGDDARLEQYLALSANGAGANAIESYRRLMRPDAKYEKTIDHWNAPILRMRETGDGKELVLALTKEHSTGRRVLARVLPGITKDRRAVDVWLEELFPQPCVRCGIWAVAANVADRREAARLLGNQDVEERSAKILARLAPLLLRRDGAPQWMVLERALAAKP
jgi:hypothetical protein